MFCISALTPPRYPTQRAAGTHMGRRASQHENVRQRLQIITNNRHVVYHCFRNYMHGHNIVFLLMQTVVIATSKMLTPEKLPVE